MSRDAVQLSIDFDARADRALSDTDGNRAARGLELRQEGARARRAEDFIYRNVDLLMSALMAIFQRGKDGRDDTRHVARGSGLRATN